MEWEKESFYIMQRKLNIHMQNKQTLRSSFNTIHKSIKRQLSDWNIIFANHISDREFMPRIHKELLMLNNKKRTTR